MSEETINEEVGQALAGMEAWLSVAACNDVTIRSVLSCIDQEASAKFASANGL